MNLMFIHRAPAVGKLTVAKELSKITGYKIFHNNLTLVLADSLFSSKQKVFWMFVEKIRLDSFGFAAQNSAKGIFLLFGICLPIILSFPEKQCPY